MSQSVYISHILNSIVKPWILQQQRGHIDRFVLEEDGDSGHDPFKTNPVRSWKEQNQLKFFFNCAHSPDLSSIETCWQPLKQYLRKISHWDDSTTKDLVVEGWDSISMNFINEKCGNMPQRLKDVIELDGQMTGH